MTKTIRLNKNNIELAYIGLHNKNNFGNDTEFVLETDLDFTEIKDFKSLNERANLNGHLITNGFLPISGDDKYSLGGNTIFNAKFYGNDHQITIGDINYKDAGNFGFFGIIGDNGMVKNLNLKIGNINGDFGIGGFVGNNSGKISNSSIKISTVNGKANMIGGFAGVNDGEISNCSVDIETVGGRRYVGGFVGYNSKGKISNSSLKVTRSINGYGKKVGDFVGLNEGKIKNVSKSVEEINVK